MSQTIWLTGLSGSGKTTLSLVVRDFLVGRNIPCEVIDGDELRQGISAGLGFSREDRRENIRRAAEHCRILNQDGKIAIAALISPYATHREMARHLIGPLSFIEVWVNTPLEVCEARDPKGLYRKARMGEIASFTGITDPYEPPVSPDLVLHTEIENVVQCLERIKPLFGLDI